MHRIFFLIFVVFFACSSEKPAELAKEKPFSTKDGKGYLLEITPLNAVKNSVLNLNPKGFNLSEAKIEWFINSTPVFQPVADKLQLTEAGKGDLVQAKAIVYGNEVFSNVIKINNSPPEIASFEFMPQFFKPGDTLYINVIGSDIDGDEVTFFYEWTNNGQPAGTDKSIGAILKRGDKFSVKVTPFDGESYGAPVIILDKEVKNFSPIILDYDSKGFFSGNIFFFQISATDYDGDSLTYSLKEAPQGMTIDKSTGLVKWGKPVGYKGKVSFTVSVSDSYGGETIQQFTYGID
jgi:hypothetical protein